MKNVSFYPETLETEIYKVDGEEITTAEAGILPDLSIGFFIENNGDEDCLCRQVEDEYNGTITTTGDDVLYPFDFVGGRPIKRPTDD